jgi:hypothetical protein
VYGPVRTVVWQGSAGDCGPYADLTGNLEVKCCSVAIKAMSQACAVFAPTKGLPDSSDPIGHHRCTALIERALPACPAHIQLFPSFLECCDVGRNFSGTFPCPGRPIVRARAAVRLETFASALGVPAKTAALLP